jgi:hypothetical protein
MNLSVIIGVIIGLVGGWYIRSYAEPLLKKRQTPKKQ